MMFMIPKDNDDTKQTNTLFNMNYGRSGFSFFLARG